MNDQCETCPIFDECPAREKIEGLEAERDEWKARAEALERAIKKVAASNAEITGLSCCRPSMLSCMFRLFDMYGLPSGRRRLLRRRSSIHTSIPSCLSP